MYINSRLFARIQQTTLLLILSYKRLYDNENDPNNDLTGDETSKLEIETLSAFATNERTIGIWILTFFQEKIPWLAGVAFDSKSHERYGSRKIVDASTKLQE